MKCNQRFRMMILASMTAGIASCASAQIQPGGYSCVESLDGSVCKFSLSNNNSTAITIKTVACGAGFQSTYAHWFDLGFNSDLAGSYTILRCVDFSYWASNRFGDQPIFIRVYQDLTPGRAGQCTDQGYGDPSDPGPDRAGRLLLWEGETVFPPSSEGVSSSSTPRPDGDRSIGIGPDVNQDMVPDGVLLPPNAQFFVEVGDRGETLSRFGANNLGEEGDTLGPASASVTWTVNPNCNGGGCVTLGGIEGGDYAKHSEFFGENRDFVMQVHLDLYSPGYCHHYYRCAGDTNNDTAINIWDLLNVLGDWIPEYCLGNVSNLRAGDVYPNCPDGRVNVDDLLHVLGNWGYCPLKYDSCLFYGYLPVQGTMNWHNVTATDEGPWHSDLGLGSYCGFDEGLGDVFGPGDIWYLYRANCPGRVIFSTEGSPGITDTIMEIWPLYPCMKLKPSDLIACNDDIGPDNLHSRISLDLEESDSVLVRVAGRIGEQGQGILTTSFEPTSTPDCNGNGINDRCDIRAFFTSRDWNYNGVPDECDARGDLDGNGVVNVMDLLLLLGDWGACDWNCPSDMNDDDVVDVEDLLNVLANWD